MMGRIGEITDYRFKRPGWTAKLSLLRELVGGDPKQLFSQMDALAQAIQETVISRADLLWQISRDKATLEDDEAEALINGYVEGKNATERAASLRLALNKSVAYAQHQEQLRASQAHMADIEAELESSRNRFSVLTARLKFLTAEVKFLAGE